MSIDIFKKIFGEKMVEGALKEVEVIKEEWNARHKRILEEHRSLSEDNRKLAELIGEVLKEVGEIKEEIAKKNKK